MMIHIHDFAKMTGVTTRTLRYYDQIDLLTPSSTTEGNHRLYEEEHLQKLQQIQFLKGMGFSLQEIKDMLKSQKWDWSVSLKNQLYFVVQEQEKLKAMEASLRELINGLIIDSKEHLLTIQKLIQLSQSEVYLRKHYRKALFSHREVDLFQRLPKMTGNDPNSLEWIALLGQIREEMHTGPAAPKVQNIIRRMHEKKMEQFAEEDDFINKLWEIRKSPSQSEQLGFYPIEMEVLEFLEQADAIYSAGLTADLPERKTSIDD